MINVPRTVFAEDCYEKLTSHWMGFYRSLDQSKHLIYMLLKWRKRLIRPGRSTRFVVGLKDQMRKSREVRGRVDQRMRGIHEHRTMTRSQLSVFVVDVRVIALKILLVLQSEKTCSNCGKQGHFAGVCKSAPKRVTDSPNIAYQRNANGLRYVAVEDNTDSDDEYLFAIGSNREDNTVQITVEGTLIPVIVDSGASVNVLDSATFNRLSESGVILRDSRVKIYAYGSKTPLPVKGIFKANVSTSQLQTQADFVVVENLHAGSLLGKKTATDLGLLRVGPEYLSMVNQSVGTAVHAIVNKHDAVFNGVGKLKDYQLKVHLNPDITPVAQPQRRLPFHVRKDVEKKLQELQDLDIIEDVEGPTPWVSPLVAVPKSNGDVRVCVDMRRANEAVIPKRHPIPTL